MFVVASAHAAESSTNSWILLLLGVLAILPGLGAVWVSLKTRRDQTKSDTDENKTDLVELGATILTEEIGRLTNERHQWESERRRWMEDKADLLQKVNHLSNQLDALNRYLVEVLALLRAHSIDPPDPPRHLRIH